MRIFTVVCSTPFDDDNNKTDNNRWQWWTTSFAIVTWFVHLVALLRRFMVTSRLLIIALHVVNFSYQTWQANTIWCTCFCSNMTRRQHTCLPTDLEEGVKAAGFSTLHTRGAVYLAGCLICSVISACFFIMLGSGRSASLDRIYHGVADVAPAKADDGKGGKDTAAAVVEHNVVESAV